jgi:hypothetical protein
LLEVFRDLEIRGERTKLTNFLSQFAKSLPPGWKRDRAREKEIGPYLQGRQFVFQVGVQDDRPSARLFIVVQDECLKVTNIVPMELHKLTRSDYNSFVEQFSQIASPIARKLGLPIRLTSNQRDISELLDSETLRALRAFSAGANKSTGSAHPMDRNRWFRFLILAHLGGGGLDNETLQRWLVEEEKWPQAEAFELVIEFEFARDLLSKYDETRQ